MTVVLLLLIYCSMYMYFPLFVCVCVWGGGGVLSLSLFYYALLCVLSSFAILLNRKKELSALLLLSNGCLVTVNVLWLFLRLSCAGLQCVIVVFPDHTHLLLLRIVCSWPYCNNLLMAINELINHWPVPSLPLFYNDIIVMCVQERTMFNNNGYQ